MTHSFGGISKHTGLNRLKKIYRITLRITQNLPTSFGVFESLVFKFYTLKQFIAYKSFRYFSSFFMDQTVSYTRGK